MRLLPVLALLCMLTACAAPSGPGVQCPDNKFLCPDGTQLSRDPAAACTFPPCPPANTSACHETDPNYRYLLRSSAECQAGIACGPEEIAFNDSCGCGCRLALVRGQ